MATIFELYVFEDPQLLFEGSCLYLWHPVATSEQLFPRRLQHFAKPE
jgi:hypothetical protein